MNKQEIQEAIETFEFCALMLDQHKETGDKKKELIKFYVELLKLEETTED